MGLKKDLIGKEFGKSTFYDAFYYKTWKNIK